MSSSGWSSFTGRVILAELKVGVLLGSWRPPGWQMTTVRELAAEGFVDLSLYVADPAPATSERDASRRGIARRLFRLYERVDRAIFSAGDDALSEDEIAGELQPRSAGSLGGADVDVLIVLNGDRAGVRDLLPHRPVWELRFGDLARQTASTPPLFWELHRGTAVTEVSLVERGSRVRKDRVLYRACLPTDPVSLHRGRVRAYGDAAQFPLRCVKELLRGGPDELGARASWRAGPVDPRPVAGGWPSVATLALHLVRIAARAMVRVMRRHFVIDDWRIGVRRHGGAPGKSLEDMAVVRSRRGGFVADPFLLERDARHWLFFEDYSYARGKGVISRAEVHGGTGVGEARLALDAESHLAYPCIFAWRGETFMVPDASKARGLEVYRAVTFPDDWRLEAVLMEGTQFVDPTVLAEGERLWLFAAIGAERVGPLTSELSLFSADSPLGPWRPHPGNPVVTDVRRARPAGMVFRRDGELIRPGQDNSRGYGGGVTLSRIEILDADDYREVPIARLGPEQLGRACGLHTYNADGAYETIDFCRRLWRLPSIRRR